MRIKRFVAPDMRTALKMVREEHGPDAVILSNKPVHGGIEIVAATDYDEALVQQALRNAAEEPECPATALDAVPSFVAAPVTARQPELAAAEPKSISRADAMIAALAGNSAQATATRSALADRARAATRDNATPALSAMLRKPVAEAPVEAPADDIAQRPGDDFRALLARLSDDEPAPLISARAAGIAQAEAEYVQARAQAQVENTASHDDAIATPVEAAPVEASSALEPIEVEIVEPAPTPAVTASVVATTPAAPTFAELIPAPPVAIAAPAPTFVDAFDPLAEMAAAQLAAPVVAPVVTVAAPPTLQLVVNQSEDPTIVAMRNELSSMRQMI
jgi:flagellar biosynthesis protein FlhF